MSKKILLIPGWMHSVGFYKKYSGLDVWVDKKEWRRNDECEWVVGHCVGAVIALDKYQGKNVKFILVNPMFPQRSFWEWMKRWLAYFFTSGEIILNDKAMLRMNYIRGISRFIKTTKIGTDSIIKSVPVENIFVIRGKDDKYFCDDEAVGFLKEAGIKIIEIEKAGHGWNEKFNEVISKIVQ